MPLLAPNRRALATRLPEILALLDSARPGAPASVPAEPESFVSDAVAGSRVLLVLTGIPDRAAVAAILVRAPRETLFWCLEPDANALAARLAHEDLSDWLTDPRVFVSIGAPSAAQLRRLNRELAWVDRARALVGPVRVAGAENAWKQLLVPALARIQQRWQNVLTDLRLSPVRWENTCANLAAFLQAPGIEALAGAFTGLPLVLVAAGPSLDDALPFLRRVATHALIVTGNTSFRALAAHGISPHLTVTIDPFATTDLGYAGQPLEGTHLVSPVFAYPEVHRRFSGRMFGLPDQSPLLARLRTAAGQPPAPALLGDATVSATILNLAAYLGCDRAVFVGQDFAIADDGRTHAADTFYTDLGCNRQDNEVVHRLPGTTRPEVTVPSRHLWYLRTIEGLIAGTPHIRYLNTSHRGATIAGAPFATYDTVAAELTSGTPHDFASEIAARHRATPLPAIRAAMSAELGKARAAMHEALQLSLSAALSGEIAITAPSPESRNRFATAAQHFEQWRSTRATEQNLLFDGRTKSEIFEAEKRRIRIPSSAPDRQLREACETAWAFAEGCAEVFRRLQTIELHG